ncbi:unnamed protein product [Prorocentrum cordatum]|uniref:Uncharacterized protein n=1 Tax=Prorocentrum cordatum TaxID=2364126 RepID=A0ABN9VEG8_9DINO|nr:unnamed protein product [Polarella glacialis]
MRRGQRNQHATCWQSSLQKHMLGIATSLLHPGVATHFSKMESTTSLSRRWSIIVGWKAGGRIVRSSGLRRHLQQGHSCTVRLSSHRRLTIPLCGGFPEAKDLLSSSPVQVDPKTYPRAEVQVDLASTGHQQN